MNNKPLSDVLQRINNISNSLSFQSHFAKYLSSLTFCSYKNSVIEFETKSTQVLQNTMGNLYGGAMGLMFEEVSDYLVALNTSNNLIGEIISMDIDFYRGVPTDTFVIINLSIIHSSSDLIYINAFLKSKETNKKFGEGKIIKRISGESIWNIKVKDSNIQCDENNYEEKEEAIVPVPLDSISSNNYKFIDSDEKLSKKRKENIQQLIWWISRVTDKYNFYNPTEFSAVIMNTSVIDKLSYKTNQLDFTFTVTKDLLNSQNNIHFAALYGILDEVTSLLKMSIADTNITFVTITMGLQQFIHKIPLNEKFKVSSTCGKQGRRFYFLRANFIYQNKIFAMGTHILTPSVLPSNL